MHFLREQEQQRIKDVIDSFGFRDGVIVVEDDDEGIGDLLLNFVDECANDGVGIAESGTALQNGLGPLADVRKTAVNRGDQIF